MPDARILDVAKLGNVEWVEADLRDPPASTNFIKSVIATSKIDALIYNAGVWESTSFKDSSADELKDIVNINMLSLLLLTNKLFENLASSAGHVVLIGSDSGLPNSKSTSVAYAGTKAGMNAISESLRENLKGHGVRVTVVNPGSMATDFVYGEKDKALEAYASQRIPVEDIIDIIRLLFKLSRSANIKSIDVPSITDP